MKRGIKEGDLVEVHDWSWSLKVKDLEKNICTPKVSTLFKVVKILDLSVFPADQEPVIFPGGVNKSNDTVIQSTETGEEFYIKKRFLHLPTTTK
jgi:hypothetical protein